MVAQRTVNTTITKALQNNTNIYRSEKLSKTGKAANKKMILGAKFKKLLDNLLSGGVGSSTFLYTQIITVA